MNDLPELDSTSISENLALLEKRWQVPVFASLTVTNPNFEVTCRHISQTAFSHLNLQELCLLFDGERLIGTAEEVLSYVPSAFRRACDNPFNAVELGLRLVTFRMLERPCLVRHGVSKLFDGFLSVMLCSLLVQFELAVGRLEDGRKDVEPWNASEIQALLSSLASHEGADLAFEIVEQLSQLRDCPVGSAWFLQIAADMLESYTDSWAGFDDRLLRLITDAKLVTYHHSVARILQNDDNELQDYFATLHYVLSNWQ